MNNGEGCNNKWEQEVEGKEAGEGGIVYGKAPPDSLHKRSAYIGYGGEKVGNDRSTPEGHLTSG